MTNRDRDRTLLTLDAGPAIVKQLDDLRRLIPLLSRHRLHRIALEKGIEQLAADPKLLQDALLAEWQP